MTDERIGGDAGGDAVGEERAPSFYPPQQIPEDSLRRAVSEVMAVEAITLPRDQALLRFSGRLTMPADEAFDQLRPRFEAHGRTPHLFQEDGQDVVEALPGVYGKQTQGFPWTNVLLLFATIFSVFLVGMQGEIYLPLTQVFSALITGNMPAGAAAQLMPTTAELWQAAGIGGLYALALLGILGAHEMGHYLVARHYHVDVTPPFFIPLPIGFLGTLGAVIAMREPAPNRRIQFDIGVAGPLAGLIVAVPVMVIGLMLSEVGTQEDFLQRVPEPAREGTTFFREGNSLAYLGLKYLVFGEVLPDGNRDVWVHPVAFAAWAGFLVTMLNLIPVGQLDGGHVVYGLFGDKAQLARWPAIAILAAMTGVGLLNEAGITNLPFGWSGWWVWILILLFLARSHAPVLDEITELTPGRKALGIAVLVIFVLIFIPRPIVIDAEPAAALLSSLF